METVSINTLQTAQTNNLESTFKINEQDEDIENNLTDNLYKSDDCDEGDISSDDSLRLRLSDDEEAEIEEDLINNRASLQHLDKAIESHQSSSLVKETEEEESASLTRVEYQRAHEHYTSIRATLKKIKERSSMHANEPKAGRWRGRFHSLRNVHGFYHHPRPINGRAYFCYKQKNNRYYNPRASFYSNKYFFSPLKKRCSQSCINDQQKESDGNDSANATEVDHVKCKKEEDVSNEERELANEAEDRKVDVKSTLNSMSNDVKLKTDDDVVDSSNEEVDTRQDNESVDDSTIDKVKVEQNETLTEEDDQLKQEVDELVTVAKLETTVKIEITEETKVKEEESQVVGNVSKHDNCDDDEESRQVTEGQEDDESKSGDIVNDNEDELNMEEKLMEIDEKYDDMNDDVILNEDELLGDTDDAEVAKTTSGSNDEHTTEGDKAAVLDEMSIDISSDNESENVSNFIDSSQDSMTNEDSSDRSQNNKVETEKDDEKSAVDEKDENNQATVADENTEEQNGIVDSNEEETSQVNSEIDENLMELDSSKADSTQVIDEVEIEESAESQIELYESPELNVTEESSKKSDSVVTETTSTQPLPSPSSLKRNMETHNTENQIMKKAKIETDNKTNQDNASSPLSIQKPKILHHVRNFFQKKGKKLSQMTQAELMDLLIQKYAEAITMNSEIGKLKEQLQIADKNQDAMKARCQQLTKQLKDFEMVLKRNELDRKTSNDKFVAPIKINRSVGLQVTLLTEQGMQTLRQVQGAKASLAPTNATNNRGLPATNGQRRGIKVHSPRRTLATTNSLPSSVQSTQTVVVAQTASLPTTTTAVVTKANELPQISRTITIPSNTIRNTTTITNQVAPKVAHVQQRHIVINGNIASPANRQQIATLNVQKVQQTSKSNDLIDLTDEEDKKKAPNRATTLVTQAITQPTIISDTVMKQHNAQTPQAQIHGNARYQRVIQTISGNIINQNNIRVVQPATQLTPTSLVSNSAPRLTYIMPTGVGQGRQVLITNTNQIRPMNANTRNQYSTVTYKTNVSSAGGVTGLPNGTVTRILTTQACANIQIPKHPAPLPATPPCEINPMWKLPPPAPSLKISRMGTGIVLSWTMSLTDKYEDIASYQLFAYQEVAGAAPSTSLWKKVGDVRALPLPMACTLTQFATGNNYYFAVRAVDTHSRLGQYSQPGNISL